MRIWIGSIIDGTIGYIVYIDESLKEKEESKVRGKEGFSLGIYSIYTSQASRMRVAGALQLYNYLLRFYLTVITFFLIEPY